MHFDRDEKTPLAPANPGSFTDVQMGPDEPVCRPTIARTRPKRQAERAGLELQKRR